MSYLESLTLCLSSITAALGVTVLLAVTFFWPRVARYYRETGAKFAVAGFRFLAAAAALAGKSVPAAGLPALRQPWGYTLLAAIIGYLVWEAVGIVGDAKWKATKDKTRGVHDREMSELILERDDALKLYDRLTLTISHTRALVRIKLQRIRTVLIESARSRGSLPKSRSALASDTQIRVILESLASLFRADVTSTGGSYDQNFRVGLYVEKSGQLVAVDAFDLNSRVHDPFSSFERHPDRFELDNSRDPSHAVRCVLLERTLIVADCLGDPDFRYFDSRQATYLRSMVAYPLPQFRPDGVKLTRAALVVDTDVSGHFREDDREILELRLKEFATRIELEYVVTELLR